MPVFAGGLFTEWYWEPLFLLVVTAPVLIAAAAAAGGLAAWRARRAGRRPSRAVGARVLGGYAAAQVAVLLGWSLLWGGLNGWRDAPGLPAPAAPPGFQRTFASGSGGTLWATYESPAGTIQLHGGPYATAPAGSDALVLVTPGGVRYAVGWSGGAEPAARALAARLR